MTETEKVVIIGSGPAGLTAALYASRAMLSPLVFMGQDPGGQLTITTDVENYPGFPEGIQGPELMENMRKQAERFGALLVPERVTAVDFSRRPFTITITQKTYRAETVIIASGASAKWLGLPSEQEYRGRGVSSCATCDAFFFKGKKIFAVGGGNVALEDALFLAKFADQVTLVHRRDVFRGEKILQDRVFENPKISVLWNTTIEEVLGDGTKVTGVLVKDEKTGVVVEHTTDGLFVFIGHQPNTALYKEYLQLDPHGYVQTIDEIKTQIPGIFVAGDVADFTYRQAITAAGSGCKAALEVERFLELNSKKKP